MQILTSFRYMTFMVPTLVASLILAALAFTYNKIVTAHPEPEAEATITVSGTATVSAKPDVASFHFTLRGESDTQEATQRIVTEREATILAYLEEQEVSEKDITTSYYNLSPRYEYEIDTTCRGDYCPGKQVQVGYQASESIMVTVRNLEQAGELIAGVGARGAENVSQLSFTIDDPAMIHGEALLKAIEDAREKAEIRADALDVRLGKIQSFYEDGNRPLLSYQTLKAGDAVAESAPSPTLPAGESEYTATVSVTYFIK